MGRFVHRKYFSAGESGQKTENEGIACTRGGGGMGGFWPAARILWNFLDEHCCMNTVGKKGYLSECRGWEWNTGRKLGHLGPISKRM